MYRKNYKDRSDSRFRLERSSFFWDVVEGVVTLAAIVAIIAALCFAAGFFWYVEVP